MESHFQHHRSGPGGEIRDKRNIVQVCVTPQAAVPVRQEFIPVLIPEISPAKLLRRILR